MKIRISVSSTIRATSLAVTQHGKKVHEIPAAGLAFMTMFVPQEFDLLDGKVMCCL